MKAGSVATRSDRITHRLIRSLRYAPFPAFIHKIRHGGTLVPILLATPEGYCSDSLSFCQLV